MSAAKVQRKATEPYQQKLDEVVSALSTDPRLGLSEAEARSRLENSAGTSWRWKSPFRHGESSSRSSRTYSSSIGSTARPWQARCCGWGN